MGRDHTLNAIKTGLFKGYSEAQVGSNLLFLRAWGMEGLFRIKIKPVCDTYIIQPAHEVRSCNELSAHCDLEFKL